jgi:hypothetical protein
MKTHCVSATLLASCLILFPACSKKVPPGGTKVDRLVTIQAGGTLGCEVDYPIAVVYMSKHYPRWSSADHEYWIHFAKGSPFPVDIIDVPSHGISRQLDITGLPKYYTYEILSADSNGGQKICKAADDDHDTGLNVKR